MSLDLGGQGSYEADDAGDELRGLLRGLHPYDSRQRWCAVIYIYGDISGTPKNDVVVAATYIGHENAWATIDKRWATALRDAKVDHFHATDFFADPPQGAFKGWKYGSRRWRQAMQAFTTATRPRPRELQLVKGYAVGIVTSGFPKLRDAFGKTQSPHRIRSLRLACFLSCLWWVDEWFSPPNKGLPRGERIQVFLENEKGIGEVVDYFNYMKERGATWTRHFLTVAPVDKRVRPAQVADLFAHESWKALENQQTLPAAEPRPSFARLLEGENHEVRLMTEEDVMTSLPKIERFLAKYPRGYISKLRRPRAGQ